MRVFGSSSERRSSKRLLLPIFLLVLVTAALRIPILTDVPMNWDEVWSIWQSMGSLEQTIRLTPGDWPPTYFIMVNLWQSWAGFTPLVLRALTLFIFLLGIPITYRAVREMTGCHTTAVFSAFGFSALGFGQFLSVLVRAYGLLLTLTMLALWLTALYFNRRKLTYGILLSGCLALMFLVHYTAFFICLLLGLYTLLTTPKQIWRWWLPALVVAFVGSLQVLPRLDYVLTRTDYNSQLALPSLPIALTEMFATFSGSTVGVLILAAAALAAMLYWRNRAQAAAVVLWSAAPLLMYLLHNHLGLFQDARYLWWVLPGLALLIGLGVSSLPRPLQLPGTTVVLLLMLPINFVDYQLREYGGEFEPIDGVFADLKKNLRPGDVILVDPKCGCAPPEAWDYYMQIHFPGGLPFVESAEGYPRIWYVSRNWDFDAASQAQVAAGRIAGKYIGPPGFFFQLYEGPPDPEGILFENGIRFHGATFTESVNTPDGPLFHEGAEVQLQLWWLVDRPIALDYSISLFGFFRSGVVQSDRASITNGPLETSRWQPGQFYVDERVITIPAVTPPGTYALKLAVYQFWDNQRIAANGYTDEDVLLPITHVRVHSW
ncbi:MAG: glycosyltransferase family 39 protein [Anaerolineae bacterium]|nr:glycosyltransferase family 39 protein [Anaerolineae bacterium]